VVEQVEQSQADRLELISRLKGNVAVKAAHEEIVALKREYESNLGHTLMTGTRLAPPVDQREIDYQRGFYRGLLWAYTIFLDNAGPKLDRLLDKEMAIRAAEESDTA
jgi:hypothetical protein